MRPNRLLIATCAAALAIAGLVYAQPTQPPPPSDPVSSPEDVAPPSEEPPPAPGETTTSILPPGEPMPPIEAPPEPSVKAEAVKADEEDKPAAKPAEKAEAVVPPEKRLRHGAAVIQALDKITAETMRFEARVGRSVRYKGLVFTVRSCETTAADEPMSDSVAYLEVRAEPKANAEKRPSRQVFRGWMFASSPGVAAIEHPVYDAWLIACKA